MLKNLKKKALTHLTIGTLAFSGCRTAQNSYNADPVNSSFFKTETGQTMNAFDATLPDNYSDSAERMGENALSLVTESLPELIDSTLGVAGLRPFRGRYLGKETKGLLKNPKGGFEPYTGDKTSHALKYGLVHLPNSFYEIKGALGSSFKDLLGIPTQALNISLVLPFTVSTDNSNDTVQTLADIPGQTLRSLLYTIQPHSPIPEEVDYWIDNIQEWGHIWQNDEADARRRNLNGSPGRQVANLIPGPLVDNLIYGIDWDGKKEVPDTINTSIEIFSDTTIEKYKKLGLNIGYFEGPLRNSPGVLIDKKLYPTRSRFVSGLETLSMFSGLLLLNSDISGREIIKGESEGFSGGVDASGTGGE
jgi:hypothetical protein